MVACGPIMKLLIATRNAGKLAEMRAFLEGTDVELLSVADVDGLPEVEEDLDTFAGNAVKKAVSAARATGRWALADDSGLAVDALGGAPGVRSARWAGRHGDDAANNARLLAELAEVAPAGRGARFVCALALARPNGEVDCVLEGEARGRILPAPRGAGGFGYDPIFLFTEPGFAQTGRGFAELAPEEKGAVSHRGRALAKLVRRLTELGQAS